MKRNESETVKVVIKINVDGRRRREIPKNK